MIFTLIEMHFNNIFEIVKSRVLELKTYEMFFDNSDYKNHLFGDLILMKNVN